MSLPDEEPAADRITVDVLRGMPSDVELAALVAVVSEAYVEEAAGALADESSGPSAWALSRRGFRAPLRRDLGWGGFS